MMTKEFFSTALTFFLVMDALGTIPKYLDLLHNFERSKWKLICYRELLIAFGIMIIFFYLGELFLVLLGVSTSTVHISGGIILLLISIRLIFPQEDKKESWVPGKHIVVPIATPIIASPSLFAAIMIYTHSELSNGTVFIALAVAWFVSAIIYLFAVPLENRLKESGLNACQRLMGLLVALIAVQKLLQGIQEIF